MAFPRITGRPPFDGCSELHGSPVPANAANVAK